MGIKKPPKTKSIFLNRKGFKKTSAFSFVSQTLTPQPFIMLFKKKVASGFLPRSHLLQGTVRQTKKHGLCLTTRLALSCLGRTSERLAGLLTGPSILLCLTSGDTVALL